MSNGQYKLSVTLQKVDGLPFVLFQWHPGKIRILLYLLNAKLLDWSVSQSSHSGTGSKRVSAWKSVDGSCHDHGWSCLSR